MQDLTHDGSYLRRTQQPLAVRQIEPLAGDQPSHSCSVPTFRATEFDDVANRGGGEPVDVREEERRGHRAVSGR